VTPSWFRNIIKEDELIVKDGRWVSIDFEEEKTTWSFSDEWASHAETRQQKTWDLTAEQRLQHFYKETKTDPTELPGKLVLDAGCGNGQLTRAIANAGAFVVGIDKQPHLPPGNENVQFVQCDLDDAPFKEEVFDIVIANGSIHHTRNTYQSFKSLAFLTRPGGKLYVWVYKKQHGWKGILTMLLDAARLCISRFPSRLQRLTVNLLTNFFYQLSRYRKGENSNRSKDEIRINVYDAFTPLYRHYHTKKEVAGWFKKWDFEEVEVTHDNNRYGFGMMGVYREK
jgi:2-polyprenyl-3-methyl-5-hydroxy-6-metoxy-1,4-benzoquinol methylase